jgi:aminopeptidase N
MQRTLLWIFLSVSFANTAQELNVFTEQDSLRGQVTLERIWWDLQQYDLSITIKTDPKFLWGTNTISYTVLSANQLMQIDLQAPMQLLKAMQDEKELKITKRGNAHFIELQKNQVAGQQEQLVLTFSGKPKTSKNPPWDAGFTWSKDKNGLDFVATSCQGQGASVWWPCKDHMYDEPDRGVNLHYTVPENLVAVGNGRLVGTELEPSQKSKTYHWKVTQPINNYGVHLSVGDYVHFDEKYVGEAGILDCSYYVLRENLQKAKQQFKEAKRTLEAFEYWFGPYPFYEDSYKLVEVPYLGMEHQSAVTYGNGYENGYRGTDLSGTGWGLKFDFIIVHESGHEWFANNITNKDIADMWIHESFTNYAESLFLEYHYGKEAADAYVTGLREGISNDRPIIGHYGVNSQGSSDMYFKGANMLHTIRQLFKNTQKWRALLRGMNRQFYHQTVSTAQIENYFSKMLGQDLSKIFDQYLRTSDIPVFEYRIDENNFHYRWTNTLAEFDMPLKINHNNTKMWIRPSNTWKTIRFHEKTRHVSVDKNFYIKIKMSKNKSSDD